MSRTALRLVVYFFIVGTLEAKESFFLVEGTTNRTLASMGPHIDEPLTPCSTFKLPLSLMGYDVGVLESQESPVFMCEGEPISPSSWMKTSHVGYSELLVSRLENVQRYLNEWGYGNRDLTRGAPFWINGSLKITPRQQVEFIRKMKLYALAVSPFSVDRTRELLSHGELEGGFSLFGKTGWNGDHLPLQIGWFVGWVERGEKFFPFAYVIVDERIDLKQRIVRVKQLFREVAEKERTL